MDTSDDSTSSSSSVSPQNGVDGSDGAEGGSTRQGTSSSGCAEICPPVQNIPLVTQIKREDDQAKAKVEAEDRVGPTGPTEVPPGSTFETRLAMKLAAGGEMKTGKEKKAEVGAKEKEEAHRRFADRLTLKMSGEDSRASPSASPKDSNVSDHIRGEEVANDVPEIPHIESEKHPGRQELHGARDHLTLDGDNPTAEKEGSRSTGPADDCDDLEMFEDGARAAMVSDYAAEMVCNSQKTVTSNGDAQDLSGLRRQRSPALQWLRSNLLRNVSGQSDNSNNTRRTNLVYDSSTPVEAMLVLDASVRPAQPMEVYEAKEVSFFESKGAVVIGMLCFILVTVTVSLAVSMTKNNETTLEPTLQPTLSPTFDPRSTLQVIQTRPTGSRKLRCGFHACGFGGFRTEVCSAIAAVVLGDPSAYEIVKTTSETRWTDLGSRRFDLLLYSALTAEREVREPTSQRGFAFSVPYYYSTTSYIGLNETLVHCAEKGERFGECLSLQICVGANTTHETHVSELFPSDFYVPVYHDAAMSYLLNGTCNVLFTNMHAERTAELEMDSGRNAYSAMVPRFVEPHAIVTRHEEDGGHEFGDIATWTIMALIYGEAHNITKDPSKCLPYEELPTNPADLDYMKAVHCVGNHGEILSSFREEHYRLNNDVDFAINYLNKGEAMIAGIPLGDLTQPPPTGRAVGKLGRIRRDNELRCGVFLPDNFNSSLEDSRGLTGLTGLNVEYCMTVSAAVLNGDTNHCILVPLRYSDKEDAYRALNNGTVDLIAGALREFKYDFRSSDDLAGVDFSVPYFYGNESITEDLSAYSLATVEDSELFSPFVNCVVVVLMWALRNNLAEESYSFMPLSSIFGSDLSWALRDAVRYSGNYATIMKRNFPGYGQSTGEEVGGMRNFLNAGQPTMHAYPGLGGL